ncbi:BadF-type ATPase [Pedococcus dokdonensis]|uniref:BadF-type ATPase n=1 Tax=Pedococcus dokdonensis TaxID=443156 RepID=A0A1H0UG44_9MICO|nr:BadF/BadG/BcrA/BcrD ATPase family protein [Pedococcus dokdonensis]SDP65103.1 BadF-type ATPase [Pedococcus dokdonensis]
MTGGPVVGVDIGGSGLRLQAWYAAGAGPVRTAPGVRIGSTGIDVAAAVADARALLDEERATGGREGPPATVVWSMRGLLFLADRTEVLRLVREGLRADVTVVVSDAVANLVGATGGLHPAAVVAAGTGAVAFGTDFATTWRRVDGWGHVLGDVGSGAWLGLEGLRVALRAADGLSGGSEALLGAGVDRFGPTESWPRQLMATLDAPERLASFAPVVTAAAPTDPVAAGLCQRAGQGLGEALLAAATGLGSPHLVATGGVLVDGPVWSALVATLAAQGAQLAPARGGALDGALLLGRRLGEEGQLPEHPAYLVVG